MIGKSFSMTQRLVLMFAAVATLAFAGAGAYLYQALSQSMASRDDSAMLNKAMLVRRVLSEVSAIDDVHRYQHLLDAVFSNQGCVLRLLGPNGSLLLQSATPSRAIGPMVAVPMAREPLVSDIHDWQSAQGQGRIISVMGVTGGTVPTQIQVVIARERSDWTTMLSEYARNVVLAIFLGSTLVTMLGFLAVRAGLYRLREVIEKANNISTHRLNTRLAVHDMPAELRKLSGAFNAMLDRLEEGVQRLSGFAADLAHDLRTPINTLMVANQVALSKPRSIEEYQLVLVSNIEEYERLAGMIENTLFLARVDNAQLALNREALDVKAELERIRDFYEGLSEEAGVKLTVAAMDVRVTADPILFQRAVCNLLSNAISHTPRGGNIDVLAYEYADALNVMVENSGPGILPEHLEHIFDRYFRVDPARSASLHSAGLGLAIVRAIMRLHGGEVMAHSEPNVKTKFVLQFGASSIDRNMGMVPAYG
ncbi:MAG: heavy metal sensor histidine kinase [Pseudomonadota bacterium]